jgi:predicted kinase
MTQPKKIMLLLIGLPGSGKSAYAKHLCESADVVGATLNGTSMPWVRINWDDLRKEMTLGASRVRFNRHAEEAMVEKSHELARLYAEDGFNIVIDNTNLNPKTRNHWAGLAEELGMELQTKTMDADHGMCAARDALRLGDARVGRAVIDRMALTYGMIKFHDKIVIVDMDGTLSDSTERQKYVTGKCPVCDGTGWESGGDWQCEHCGGLGKIKKDWDAFFRNAGQDPVNPFVYDLVWAFAKANYQIVIVSGRPMDQCGAATEKWLLDRCVPYSYLFMRHSGDNRDDTIVKKEILDKMPKDKIFCAIDDRPRIIRMWKENGINVINVGKGVEF